MLYPVGGQRIARGQIFKLEVRRKIHRRLVRGQTFPARSAIVVNESA